MNENPELIRRREVLRRAAWLLGGAISAPAALAVLQGCERQASVDARAGKGAWTPVLLSAHEAEVVSAIADIIIPKTDTSGALDAGVPSFIDAALAAVYAPADQQRFKAGCAAFDAAAKAAGGKDFPGQEPAARTAFLQQQLTAALEADADEKPFVLMTRELTLLGFFSSQVGITENMEYVPVPTAYHGCVPLSQMKKHVYWE
jgi:gluconate 2-dehydrogenase gamma chain